MIFKLLSVLTLTMGQVVALAQTEGQEPVAMDATTERARIAHERVAIDAVFLQSERGCYSRFAVSDCLREARKVKRLASDELRRQELVLNDMDRQTKAVEALKRIEANVAAQQQQLEKAAQSEAQP